MPDLTLEDLLIHEGLDYKITSGAKGDQLNIKECPKCGKDVWKVYANLESGAGNCFNCGKTFNVWRFVAFLLESRSGREPEKRDIGKYMDDVSRKMGYRPTVRQASKPTIQVTEDVEYPTSQPLPYEDGWVHPYLLERGIDGHYAAMFNLRFSAFGKHAYIDPASGDRKFQDFSNRILIPVYDLDGSLKNFQGRDITGFSEMKYKFAIGLPGTALYLYNGHVAKARKAKRFVLGEGAFDVIGIQKAIDSDYAFTDVTPMGSWGKHLSKTSAGDDQIGAFQKLRKEGMEEGWILYDPEPAAYEEALKAAELLTKIGIRSRIALLPAGVDPGDADARTILSALTEAKEFTRTSALRMRMVNPYR